MSPPQLDGAPSRVIESKLPSGGAEYLPAETYLLTRALPNFYFHLVTAHDILRHMGVSVGKRDCLFFSVPSTAIGRCSSAACQTRSCAPMAISRGSASGAARRKLTAARLSRHRALLEILRTAGTPRRGWPGRRPAMARRVLPWRYLSFFGFRAGAMKSFGKSCRDGLLAAQRVRAPSASGCARRRALRSAAPSGPHPPLADARAPSPACETFAEIPHPAPTCHGRARPTTVRFMLNPSQGRVGASRVVVAFGFDACG